MSGQIPPNPPFSKMGEPWNLEPETQNPLLDSLAWLDFCLGETAAALAAVQEAALESMRATGWKPVLPGEMEPYHEICEAAARIITLKGRVGRWGQHET
jgi:hypothetical protein